MKNITVLGIDIAKRVFQLHGVDERGKAVLKRQVSRSELRNTIARLPACLIAMEACSGSSYWAREFRVMGHEVKLIAPQFVKPFVKSNKNDAADAEAIAEAVQRPSMRFVTAKEVPHQDIQSLHMIRKRMVTARVSLTNELHGVLIEYGIVLPLSRKKMKSAIEQLIDPEDARLSGEMKDLMRLMLEELHAAEERIAKLDRKVKELSESNEVCKRLKEIPGVGPLISTALFSSVVDANAFKNGRQMSAWMGLVPRQHSTGGKNTLLGISKRGDSYLRQLLIHGARSVVQNAKSKEDRLNRWIVEKERTRGWNKTVVAVANKTARTAWVLMARGEHYQAA